MKKSFLSLLMLLVFSHLIAQDNEYPQYIWYKKTDSIHINKAIKLYELGSYHEAKKALTKASAKTLEHAACIRLFALCEFELRNYQNALEFFNMAIDREPTAVRLFFERAETLLAKKNYQQAIDDYTVYLKKFPDDVPSIMQIAYALTKLDRAKEALDLLEKNSVRYASIYTLIGSHFWVDNHDRENALKSWNLAVKFDSTTTDTYTHLILMEHESGNIEESLQYVEALIKNNPEYAAGYYLRGLLQEEQGFEEKADSSYRIAKEKGYVENEDSTNKDD